MSDKQGDFIWYELLTSDADAASDFYSAVFGWQVTDSEQPSMDYRILNMGSTPVGGLMQITTEMQDSGSEPVWLGYIDVDDVEASIDSIHQAGGILQMPAMDIPDVGRIAMVADPQGVPFYIMTAATEGESHSFSKDQPMVGHCAWNELVTTDQPAAIDFYCQQFGWQRQDEMDMGPMGSYQFLYHGYMLGAVMTKSPDIPKPMWNYYFRVADIDAAVDTITARGGQILNGPLEIPGGEFSVNALDPQGAAFALVGSRQA
jgi:predicted enzyme related to lactoylglutathione lyase